MMEEHLVIFERLFGKIPQNLGDYNPKESYGVKERVFMYGCELESLTDNNTSAPIQWNGGYNFEFHPYWKLVTGSPKIWAYENGHIQLPEGGGGGTSIPVLNEFGDNENATLSQAFLTKHISLIIAKINDELPKGVSIDIVPTSASSAINGFGVSASIENGQFERIEVYVNDVLTASNDMVSEFQSSQNISKTSVVKVIANINGIKFTKTKTIEYEPSSSTEPDDALILYIGSGNDWNDVIDGSNAIIAKENEIYKEHSVTIKQDGDKMFVILPISFEGKIGNITMSDFKIPFETITNSEYLIYKSLNKYKAGTYPIKIIKA